MNKERRFGRITKARETLPASLSFEQFAGSKLRNLLNRPKRYDPNFPHYRSLTTLPATK